MVIYASPPNKPQHLLRFGSVSPRADQL